MNAAKQAVWLFCALVALAFSGYYFASSRASTVRLDKRTLSITADTVISDLTVRQFDANGKLANYIETPELRHIPKQDTHLLKRPRIVIAQDDQPDWEIRANSARAIHRGEEITFLNQVVVHQGGDAHTEESTLKTDELTYYPQQKLATSALAVIFERPGSIVHSQGMKAYLEQKHVQLLSGARATYEPRDA